MNESSQDAGQEARSTAELLIEQGIEKGRKLERQDLLKNKVANLIKSKLLSPEQIAEVMEVPLSFVQNMAQDLENTQ